MLLEYQGDEDSLLSRVDRKNPKFSKNSKILLLVGLLLGLIICAVVIIGAIILAVSLTPTKLCTHANCIPKRYSNGAVAADNTRCSEMGAEILKSGGNAIDSAVTTALCQGVASPISSGIGGGGVVLLYLNSTSTVKHFNFREKAPLKAHRDMFNSNPMAAQRGPLSIAVPGEVMGLYRMWRDYGSLPWKDLVIPAANLARDGVVITNHMANGIARFSSQIANNTAFREMFSNNGIPYKLGDVAKYPKLAETLMKIAEDPMRFYTGDIASTLSSEIQTAGGILNITDFEKYHVSEETPMETMFHGYKIHGPRSLYTGGPCIGFGANILEFYKLGDIGFASRSSLLIAESMKHMFAWRMQLGDPDFVDTRKIVEQMASKNNSEYIRSFIKESTTFPSEYYLRKEFGFGEVDGGTTHFSIVDKFKNSVAFTATVNLEFGSQWISPTLGIVMNDEMDDFSIPNRTNAFNIPPSENNFISPGKRPLSSMSPTLVTKDNELVLSIGASGGPRIISATYQVLLNSIVFGMNIGESVNSPRIHHQLYPNELMIEEGYPFMRSFANAGHVLKPLTQRDGLLGVTQGVQVLNDGSIEASSDNRKGGQPDGY